MVNQSRKTAETTFMEYIFITGGNVKIFYDFIQNRLGTLSPQTIYSTFYQDFNQTFIIPLQQLGYKRKLFTSNNSIMGTIRRIYRQFETSRNTILKQYGKDLRYVYENPKLAKRKMSDWYTMLNSPYPPFIFKNIEYILNNPSNYGEIGYYSNEYNTPIKDLFEYDSNNNQLFEIIYKKCCNICKVLHDYYYASRYYNQNFTKSSVNPLEIKLVLCIDFNGTEIFFVVKYHTFGDYNYFLKEVSKILNWGNKHIKTNNTPNEIIDKKPETPDIDELLLKWIRPTICLSSNNMFNERIGEIGFRLSNYIQYV